jgi:hypothetical protein
MRGDEMTDIKDPNFRYRGGHEDVLQDASDSLKPIELPAFKYPASCKDCEHWPSVYKSNTDQRNDDLNYMKEWRMKYQWAMRRVGMLEKLLIASELRYLDATTPKVQAGS